MAKRVLIATVGSFGDLHPYMAIARGLIDRGHAVTLASCGYYKSKVEADGIAFVAIPPHLTELEDNPEVRRRAMNKFDGTRYVLQKIFVPPVEEAYRILLREAAGMDVTIGSTFAFALPMVAAKLKIPYLSTMLQPAAMLSKYDLPYIPAAPYLRFILPYLTRMNKFLLKPVYALAKREGLPESAVPQVFKNHSPDGNLVLFSKHFMAPQPDFPQPLAMCGFPFYDTDPLDAELAAFLDAGDAPYAFTLGTSAVLDPGRFYEEAHKAVVKMKKRAVFLVGKQNLDRYQRFHSEQIFVTPYAPHRQLMPRSAATVHQGGIGTTAQALRAGKPMIVVPYSHDQPDNARRCVKLGVGLTIPRGSFSARLLEEALLAAPKLALRAKELGALIQAEDAVGVACEKIAATQASPRTI